MPESRIDPSVQSSCPHCASARMVVVKTGGQTAWWVIAVALAVIATALIARLDADWLSRSAVAQSAAPGVSPTLGVRGISAFAAQLGSKEYGLYMVDVDTGTVWCDQLARGRDGQLQMQLVAARSWIFDRFLEEFNVAKPTPGEVQLMVRQQRGNAAAAGLPWPATVGGTTGEPASRPALPDSPLSPALPTDDAN